MSFPTKKTMAAAVVGAGIAGSLAPSAVPAAPGDHAAGPPCVPPPPSRIAVSAEEEYARLRSACGPLASTTRRVADASTMSGGFDAPSAAIGAAVGTGLVLVLLTTGGFAGRDAPTRVGMSSPRSPREGGCTRPRRFTRS